MQLVVVLKVQIAPNYWPGLINLNCQMREVVTINGNELNVIRETQMWSNFGHRELMIKISVIIVLSNGLLRAPRSYYLNQCWMNAK